MLDFWHFCGIILVKGEGKHHKPEREKIMAKKELRFLVFDCETATMAFANEIAQGDPERKKKIAIASDSFLF